MSDSSPTSTVARRSFFTRLGTGVTVAGTTLAAGALDRPRAVGAGRAWQPTRACPGRLDG